LVTSERVVSSTTKHAEYRREGFLVTTDAGRFDRETIHAFLARSYWAEGIPREIVDRSIEGSLAFGLFEGERQIGFARVVTDRATFGYLADVFVLETRRGQGLGRWLVECVTAHPDLQGLRRWSLVTQDAHEVYRPFGFEALRSPERHMERVLANAYRRADAS
jgi:GNAT superfamily N-acetyltransferase